MTFKQAVLLVIVVFVFITFVAGYADPVREPERGADIRPGFIPVIQDVIEG